MFVVLVLQDQVPGIIEHNSGKKECKAVGCGSYS